MCTHTEYLKHIKYISSITDFLTLEIWHCDFS